MEKIEFAVPPKVFAVWMYVLCWIPQTLIVKIRSTCCEVHLHWISSGKKATSVRSPSERTSLTMDMTFSE
jgi:hypothetical protein